MNWSTPFGDDQFWSIIHCPFFLRIPCPTIHQPVQSRTVAFAPVLFHSCFLTLMHPSFLFIHLLDPPPLFSSPPSLPPLTIDSAAVHFFSSSHSYWSSLFLLPPRPIHPYARSSSSSRVLIHRWMHGSDGGIVGRRAMDWSDYCRNPPLHPPIDLSHDDATASLSSFLLPFLSIHITWDAWITIIHYRTMTTRILRSRHRYWANIGLSSPQLVSTMMMTILPPFVPSLFCPPFPFLPMH